MMKKIKYIILIGVVFLFAACESSEKEKKVSQRQDVLEQIKKIEAEMRQSATLNEQVAHLGMTAYADFITQFPQDTLSADFLFKSAEIATAVKQYDDAYADYQKIEKYYPKYKLVEESIYLQAYLLDNFMNQDGKAKMVYEHLIEQYPSGRYVKDAQFAIENLGKSDEELMKEFKKKNGQN